MCIYKYIYIIFRQVLDDSSMELNENNDPEDHGLDLNLYFYVYISYYYYHLQISIINIII